MDDFLDDDFGELGMDGIIEGLSRNLGMIGELEGVPYGEE
jgi:hypothetical protein